MITTDREVSRPAWDGPSLQFVKFGPKDLDELVAFERDVFHHPWSRDQFKLSLDQQAFHIFGFTQRNRIVAYCSFSVVEDEAEILNIAVRTEQRRKGLGRRLLSLVVDIHRRLGVERIFLESRPSNLPALELYRGMGFVPVGVRKNYYPDTNEDASLLRLSL